MLVYYLPSDYVGDVEGRLDPDFEKQVKEHPEVLVYTIWEFQEAFNAEEISDLGYIVIESEV